MAKQNEKTIQKSSIYNLVAATINFFESNYFDSYLEGYKLYLCFKWDRSLSIESWQTNISYPIVPTIVDTLHSTMFDNQSIFSVWAYNKEDKERVDKPRQYLNWSFDVSKSRDELMDIVKEWLIVWNWFWKITMVEDIDKVTIRTNKWWVTEKIFKKQYCWMEYKSCFEIFYDPSVKNFKDSRYVIERWLMNSWKILKNYSLIIKSAMNFKTTDEAINHLRSVIAQAKNEPMRFSEMDCNIIRDINLINVWRKRTTIWVWQMAEWLAASSSQSIERYNNIYKIEFAKEWSENVHEVIEYWENQKFILNIDWYEVCSVNKNPLGREFIPYFHVPINKVPGRVNWQGIAISNADFQQIANTLYNIFLDNLKMSIAPMFEKLWWIDSMLSKTKKLKYDPYAIIHTNTPNSLKKLDLGLNDFSPINALVSLEGLVEKRVWINEYVMWNQGKVERTAAWVEQLATAFQRRMLPVYSSLSWAMAFVAKSWLFLAITHFDNKFNIYEWQWKERAHLEVTVEELLWDFTFFWDARAAVSASKQMQRDKLEKLLPLIRMAIDPATQRPLINWEPLWRSYIDSLNLEMWGDIVMDMEDYIASQVLLWKSQEEIKSELRKASSANLQPWQEQQPQWDWSFQLNPWTIPETWYPNKSYGNFPKEQQPTQAQVIESQPWQTIREPAMTEFKPDEEPYNQDSIEKYISNI